MSGVKTSKIFVPMLLEFMMNILLILSPEDAFMKTSTGFIMQNDRLPTIYQINQVSSIKITAPTDTQKKIV